MERTEQYRAVVARLLNRSKIDRRNNLTLTNFAAREPNNVGERHVP